MGYWNYSPAVSVACFLLFDSLFFTDLGGSVSHYWQLSIVFFLSPLRLAMEGYSFDAFVCSDGFTLLPDILCVLLYFAMTIFVCTGPLGWCMLTRSRCLFVCAAV